MLKVEEGKVEVGYRMGTASKQFQRDVIATWGGSHSNLMRG
jgi:hypothetical protein